jgi:hypothetical protein
MALRVLLVARKCMLSCWGRVGTRTVVGTVRFANPTGSGGISATGTPTVKVSQRQQGMTLQPGMIRHEALLHERQLTMPGELSLDVCRQTLCWPCMSGHIEPQQSMPEIARAGDMPTAMDTPKVQQGLASM